MHYNDVWEEEHAVQFKMEREAFQNRKQLLETLNAEEMVRIMFKDYLHKLSDYKVNELKREYVEKRRYNAEIIQ